MFEINENGIDVVQVTGIGPHGINVMLLDNFYQNPDEVRELALKGRRESHKSAFGRTAFMPTWEFAAKTKHIFDGICFDENLWFNETDSEVYEESWKNAGFMVRYTREEEWKSEPKVLIPHQESYPLEWRPCQFVLKVCLNNEFEDHGGEEFFTFMGDTTVPKSCDYLYKDELAKPTEEAWKDLSLNIHSSMSWEKVSTIPMEYNRAILFQSQILHRPQMINETFKDHDRLEQFLFL